MKSRVTISLIFVLLIAFIIAIPVLADKITAVLMSIIL